MARVVVRDGRLLHDADPAAVWALVADPERVEEWAPVCRVGYLGTGVPSVGHTLFLGMRRGGHDAEHARRFRISEWDAGHRFRCVIEGSRFAEAEHIDVIVTSEVEGGRPAANLELRYVGELPGWIAPWYRWMVAGKLRRAVERVERLFAPR